MAKKFTWSWFHVSKQSKSIATFWRRKFQRRWIGTNTSKSNISFITAGRLQVHGEVITNYPHAKFTKQCRTFNSTWHKCCKNSHHSACQHRANSENMFDIRSRSRLNFGFGTEADNKCNFGVVSILLECTVMSYSFNRNYEWFRYRVNQTLTNDGSGHKTSRHTIWSCVLVCVLISYSHRFLWKKNSQTLRHVWAYKTLSVFLYCHVLRVVSFILMANVSDS